MQISAQRQTLEERVFGCIAHCSMRSPHVPLRLHDSAQLGRTLQAQPARTHLRVETVKEKLVLQAHNGVWLRMRRAGGAGCAGGRTDLEVVLVAHVRQYSSRQHVSPQRHSLSARGDGRNYTQLPCKLLIQSLSVTPLCVRLPTFARTSIPQPSGPQNISYTYVVESGRTSSKQRARDSQMQDSSRAI